MRGKASASYMALPANWIAGRDGTLAVMRDGAETSVNVPVIGWTPAAWWRYNVLDISRQIDFLGALLLFGVGFFTFLKRPAVPAPEGC